MPDQYYTTDGRQPLGPFSPEQLADTGLAAEDLVWAEGWPQWRPAGGVPELAGAVRPAPGAATVGGFPPVPPQPPPSPDRVWMVQDQGRQLGPLALSEVAQGVAAGTISGGALAWQAGMPQWVPVSSIVPVPMYAQPYGQPTGAASTDHNKLAAGLCGILVGAFGVHKFILGFPLAGGIMLGVTVATCGYGGFVMGIIGLIEGIIYMSKSDRDFYQTYVVEKKQWF